MVTEKERPSSPGPTGSPVPMVAIASCVTSCATPSAEDGSAEQCPLADPSEAGDVLGRGWVESGGFVRSFQKKARSARCKGSGCPRSDLVSVAGGGRRSEPRRLERSRNIGYGSRCFTEPGTLEPGFALVHPCRSPGFPLPIFLPLTPASAPAPSPLAPLTGRRCEG